MQQQTIFIHAGFPKTATTFLQKHVFPQLSGITYSGRNYPVEERVEDDTKLSKSFRVTRSMDEQERARLRDLGATLLGRSKAASQNSVFFSGEGIIGQCMAPIPNPHDKNKPYASPTARQALEHARGMGLEGGFASPKLILTLRKQTDLLTSFFAEAYGGRLARVPQTDTFEKYADEIMSGSLGLLDTVVLEFDKLYDLSCEIFGAKNVLLLDYGSIKGDPPRFAERFSNFLGVDAGEFLDLLTSKGEENVRRSKSGKSQLKMRRKTAVSKLDDLKARFFPKRSLGIGRLLAPFLKKFESGETSFVPPEAKLEEIRAHYAASNRRLAARFPEFDLPC